MIAIKRNECVNEEIGIQIAKKYKDFLAVSKKNIALQIQIKIYKNEKTSSNCIAVFIDDGLFCGGRISRGKQIV